MGIFTINSDLNPASTLIKESIARARQENKAINETNRDKLDDFYHGRQYKAEYLENYGHKDSQIPLTHLNITKKIIDKISLIYKYQPDRQLIPEMEKDKYQEFIVQNPFLNVELKRAERLKNLFGNVLFRPMYYNNKWNFWIETEWIPHFLEGNALVPIGYSIPVKRETTETERGKIDDRQWYMYWSDEFYYWHDDDGMIKYDSEYPDGLNPFGRLPFLELRQDSAINEYWPEGVIDLVDANEAINVALNDINYAVHFQAFNQPYGKGITQDQASTIKFGASNLIGLSEPDMELSLLNYSPQLTPAMEVVRKQIEMIGNMYNVNIQWSLQGTPPSGFSLLVQNIDLLEAREDDVNYAEVYEQEIYKIIQVQDKVLKLGLGLPELSEKTKLVIDFQEINFPVNQKEEIERWNWEIENNIKTPIDYIQSSQGLTEEEAEERYIQNKAVNERLSFREKMLKDELDKQGVIIEPSDDTEK